MFNDRIIIKSQQRFRSYHHIVFTEEVNKIALSSNDDKRIQTFDKVTTFPYGTNVSKVCENDMLLKNKLNEFDEDIDIDNTMIEDIDNTKIEDIDIDTGNTMTEDIDIDKDKTGTKDKTSTKDKGNTTSKTKTWTRNIDKKRSYRSLFFQSYGVKKKEEDPDFENSNWIGKKIFVIFL